MIGPMITFRARQIDKKCKHLSNFPTVTLQVVCYLFFYKELEDLLKHKPSKYAYRLDQFSRQTVSKCSYLKRCHLGLQY
jgi:hypothetical protein